MKKIILAMLFTCILNAHEDHDHNPHSAQPLHGGVVKMGKQINLEVIINGSSVSLFPQSSQGKDLPLKEVKVEAMAKPRKEKPYPVKFVGDTELKAIVNLKGAHRLEIEIVITHKNSKEKFIIQVE